MIAMKIDFFEATNSKFYKLLVKPKIGEESVVVDTLFRQIQKFIAENRDMRFNVYTCTENIYLKVIEFYKLDL